MADDDIKTGAEGEDVGTQAASDVVSVSPTDSETDFADIAADAVQPSASDSETAGGVDDVSQAAIVADEAAETTEAAGIHEGETAEGGSPLDGDDAEGNSEEELEEDNLPPPGPPPPEEPKDDCPKCAGGGAPAWMATFADMATLLMAFFVLLLSFAETEVPKFKQVAGSLKQAFGIEKIVPKVTIPMARSIMVENFTPAVAERSVLDVKEQRSDFVRGDFIEKKTEEGQYEDPINSDFQQVQEALEQELNKGMADVRIENGEIKVTLVEPASAGGKAGSAGEGKGGQVAQETLDAVAKVAEVSATLSSKVGVHLADQAQGNQTGANANRRL